MQQLFRLDLVRIMLLGLALASGVEESRAALGQAPTPAAAPPGARRLAATPAAQPGLYVLHEAVLENGTRVREYATPSGVVFAVTWRGPVLPDLSALLGDYFSTFKAETDSARLIGKRGSPVQLERADLVVRSGGRMRNFFGHAYAPALIPTGVNIKDVLE
ncbi:MAG: DUF2844 domain-containing protein [Rhodoferax sp.]|uniref:DUF2844 domain-containing protein n=1 Tax=Rhodoferax sp. TaxID=50421 RepID=UPI00262EE1F6|nr:DUF2844 domain-containing protein [Rhodoferax sp.]MDD5335722.1 DUF2844 domain-containing protein [Rhodoferax sp.]